jgi:TetR/AcrR family transcriptional regulator, tetracycline repressor protein
MARPKSASLTAEKVVDAAIVLIGERGLEGFSMPKLASALGVRAPSLYHYFSDRAALLAAVARAIATPAAPSALPADAHWTDYFVEQAVALRARIVAHPQCASLMARFMPRDNMFSEYEQQCEFLASAGVPAHLHVRIVDGLTALTLGAAMLVENAADYADSGTGPSPDPATHPALRRALMSVEGQTSDQLFETFVRGYLDSVLRDDHR